MPEDGHFGKCGAPRGRVAALVPAAGASRRMRGRDKLLERVGAAPLVRRQALTAQAALMPALLTLAPGAAGRRAALRGIDGVRVRTLPRARLGLSESIREGARWARGLKATGLMVVPADMPDLEAADLRALRRAFLSDASAVWRAADDAGRPGNPVIIPRRLFARLAALRGDTGARELIRGETTRLVRLPGGRARVDLDTPEDWEEWRKSQ